MGDPFTAAPRYEITARTITESMAVPVGNRWARMRTFRPAVPPPSVVSNTEARPLSSTR